MKLEGLTLFFPCRNENQNIERVLEDARRAASRVAARHELIVINDGSTDGTETLVHTLMKQFPDVRMVSHPSSQGYGQALRSGFQAAKMPWIFYTDGDGQFEMDDLELLAREAERADIVAGFRVKRADPRYRLLLMNIYHAALFLGMGLRMRDVDCAFKLIRRTVIESLSFVSTGALISAELLAKAEKKGFRIVQVGVRHKPRLKGRATGASLRVIGRAMSEFFTVWRALKK